MGIYTPDLTMFQQAFTYTEVYGMNWIIPTILVFLTMIMITRDFNRWKILALPTLLAWKIAGLPTSLVLLIIATILYVQESLNLEVFGNLLTAGTETATKTTGGTLKWITSKLSKKKKPYMDVPLPEGVKLK